MSPPSKILIIESNREAGSLIIDALKEALPDNFTQLCEQDRAAILALAADDVDAIVAHCYAEREGTAMVQALRRLRQHVPILVVASIDFRPALLAAGATSVISYGDARLIARSVTEAMRTRSDSAGLAGPAPSRR